jgi:hypothetical protein
MNIFKKIKLFYVYKSIINSNKKFLFESLNLKVDRAYRLYTVLNIDPEEFGPNFSIRKKDIDTISKPFIDKLVNKISFNLNKINLVELYDLYNIQKIDKFSYLIVIGFPLFKSNKYYTVLYSIIFILISLSTLIYIKL